MSEMRYYVKCLNPEVKAFILSQPVPNAASEVLMNIPDCDLYGANFRLMRCERKTDVISFTDPNTDEKTVPQAKQTSKGKSGKRKKSAYNMFIGDCIKERPEGQAVSDRMKTCGPQWKSLDDSKKEHYQALADKENQDG